MPSFLEIKEVVESEFEVLDSYLEMGRPTFVVSPTRTKERFERLKAKTFEKQLIPLLRKERGQHVIKVAKRALPPRAEPSRDGLVARLAPFQWLILFLLTCCTVFYAGYSSSLFFASLGCLSTTEVFIQTVLFTISMFAILGLHEVGHKIVCKIYSIEASPPYFTPGPPPLGTFGAIIVQKEPLVNRDQLFDLGISGPLVGYAVAVAVLIFGLLNGQLILVRQEQLLTLPGVITYSSLIERLLSRVIPIPFSIPDDYSPFLAPAMAPSFFGLLLTFLNLLPIWQLDGGHMSHAVFGDKGSRVLSIVGLAIMALSGFWFMAILLFFFMSMQGWKHPELLDEVSHLSPSRKIFYAIVIAITISCMPLQPMF